MISVVTSLFAAAIISLSISNSAIAEDEAAVYAFPDRWMVRISSYFINHADSSFSINSDFLGLGTTIDFDKNLGGEDRATIPRLDAYYRFNHRHRIDLTVFSVNRTGTRTATFDPPLQIGEETITGGTVDSELKYTLYKVGYVYSFYHSPKVELGLAAGLNITSYDFKISVDNGSVAETAATTLPLPVFGLRMSYAITPKWYVHYVAETFFVEVNNSFKGALYNYNISTEYKLFKHLALGAGFARIGMQADVDKDSWTGAISDSYSGFTLFGTLYF
jgi:hypothetical protein